MVPKVIISILLMALVVLLPIKVAAGETSASKQAGARQYSDASRIYIPFTNSDNLTGVEKTELFYRLDNGDWARYAEAAPGINYFEFSAPRDGLYDFAIVSTDKAGNRRTLSKSDKGEATVVIDTHEPEVKIFKPGPDEKVYPGGGLRIGWKVVDISFKTVTLQYSLDGGKTYKTTSSEKSEGTFSIDLPMTDENSIPFRLQATDRANHSTDLSFRVPISPRRADLPPPISRKVATVQPAPRKPELESPATPLSLSIAYAVQVGPSGLLRVDLYYARVLSGKKWKTDWKLWSTSKRSAGRFLFKTNESGQYAFYMVAQSNAGTLSQKRPVSGKATEPDQIKWIDPNRPTLKIESPTRGAAFRGNTTCVIRWNAFDAHFSKKPIKIEVTHDKKRWVTIVKTTENTGTYKWTTPDKKNGTFILRLTATDRAGNVTIAHSQPFIIDSMRPKPTIDAQGIRPMPSRANPTPLKTRTRSQKARSLPVRSRSRSPFAKNPYGRNRNKFGGARVSKTVARSMTNTEKAWMLFTHGNALRKAKQYNKALRQLETALRFQPNHAGVINEIGLVHAGLRNYRAAVIKFQEAIRLNPRQPLFRLNLIGTYLKQGDIDAAALAAGSLLSYAPDYKYGKHICAYVVRAYRRAGRSQDAVAFIQSVLDNKHLSKDLRNYLQSYLKPVAQ